MECVEYTRRLHRHTGVVVIKTLGEFEGCNGCQAAASCERCACPASMKCENQTARFQILCNVTAEGRDPSRLFDSGPSIDADGTIVFELHEHASGQASCSVEMHDVGALDGTHRSSVSGPQMLDILVLSVNDPPSFELLRSQIFLLEDEGMREMTLADSIFADGINGSTEISQVGQKSCRSIA